MPGSFFDVGDGGSNLTPQFGSLSAITPADEVAGTRNALGTNYGFGAKVAAAAGGAVPDLLDTASASLGITNRGQINDAILNAIGSPGLRDFYEQNRGAIEVGSGIAAVVASDFVARRFLEPAGAAMRMISKVPFVNRLATLDREYNTAMRIAQASNVRMASSGAIGVEQYVGETTFARLGREPLSVTAAEGRSIFTRRAIVRGLARNVATEAVLAATANQNDFLYSDDMSENLLWMGGGLVVGGLVDRMMGVHLLKKFANGDEMNRAFAFAYDPHGTEADRIESSFRATGDHEPSQLGMLQGHFTDLATSYKLSADEARNTDLIPGGHTNPLAGRRNRLATQQDEEVRNTLNKATTRGIAGIQGSAFGMTAEGFGNHVDYMMHRDAASLYGVEEIGAVGDGMTSRGIHFERQRQLDSRLTQVQDILSEGGIWETRTRKDPITKQPKTVRVFKQLNALELEAYAQEHQRLQWRNSFQRMDAIDGEWVPPQIGEIFDNFKEPEIIQETADDLKVWSVADRPAGKQVGIGSDLEIYLPQGRRLGTLGFHDTMGLYRAGQKVVRHFEANQLKMIVPRKANWFQLDMAEELIRRTGNEDMVQFPGGMSREDAQVESFKQKASAIGGSKKLLNSDLTEAHIARFQFNLPRLSSFEAGLMGTEEHPIEVLLRGAHESDLTDVSYRDLVEGLQKARAINGMTELAKNRGDQLSGNMFNFMVDDSGNAMRPMISYKRPFQAFEWAKDNLAERLAMRKAYVRSVLTDAQTSGQMTREITDNLLNDPDFIATSQVTGLQDSQLQSMLPGFSTAAPQTVRGGLLNDIVSREWMARDNPTLLAAARINDKVARRAGSIMQQRIESNMGDVITRINGPRNGASKLLLNQFLTYRAGWDLLTKKQGGKLVAQTVEAAAKDGRTVSTFLLDPKSIHNQQRFKQSFGRDLQEGDVLLNPQGQKIGMDELSHEFAQRFESLAADINLEKNTLNRSMGLGEINTIPLYSPPPNTKGKYIGFTLDIDNRPVPNGTIVASTPEEFTRLKAKLEDPANEFSPLNKPGNRFMTQDEITDFNTVWDNAQMNMIDPGTTAIQPNKRAKGTLLGSEINPQAMEDALTWARDSYLKHGRDLVQTIFKDQIIAAETRANIAGVSKRNAISGQREIKNPSIYDFYLQNLLGRSDRGTSILTNWRQPVEDWINSSLRGAKPAVSRTFRGAMDWVRDHKPWDTSKKATEAFNTLTDSLGEYMPFKSASEYAERQHGAKRPKELAELTGVMSKFEATMRLRMFEVIHPLMNLSGIVNAMPSVIRSMQALPGETAEEFASRVGHIAQIFHLDSDRRIGVLDMPRVIYQTFKDTWNRVDHIDWEYMRSHGYVTQEVAEFQRQWNTINSREGWKAFMFGNPHAESAIAKKGLVNWVSVLSDRSEDYSRSWGHMVGLKLADILGIEGREAQHSFAHDVANKMIANYNPLNRPAIFQGALGAPIGLFQGFIINYYQRLFRYIETGDARSFALQYALQSSLFGVTGVPGFSQVNNLFFKHNNGEHSPLDGIYERWGESGGDMLFGGVLSNLPKLLNLAPGQQGVEGIDLYSRGDTNVRLPGFNAPPIVDSFRRVVNAVTQGIAAFSSSNPNLSHNQIAEITSNMLTNRPIAGFVEVMFAGGYDTDNSGQVAAQARGLMEQTARIIGVRGLRQSKELQAFYQNRNAMAIQRARMSDLNMSSRAAIRGGNQQALPEYFNQYVQNGGDPRRFNQWMRRNMEAALETRGERQLDDFNNSDNRTELMQRLLDMGVEIPDSDADLNGGNPYMVTPEVGEVGATGPSITPMNPMSNQATYDSEILGPTH